MAEKNIIIRADIVDCNILLLLSKSLMQRAGMVIDLNKNLVNRFGKVLQPNTSSHGYYMIPIVGPPTTETVLRVH